MVSYCILCVFLWSHALLNGTILGWTQGTDSNCGGTVVMHHHPRHSCSQAAATTQVVTSWQHIVSPHLPTSSGSVRRCRCRSKLCFINASARRTSLFALEPPTPTPACYCAHMIVNTQKTLFVLDYTRAAGRLNVGTTSIWNETS